jgi:hypothetical protein
VHKKIRVRARKNKLHLKYPKNAPKFRQEPFWGTPYRNHFGLLRPIARFEGGSCPHTHDHGTVSIRYYLHSNSTLLTQCLPLLFKILAMILRNSTEFFIFCRVILRVRGLPLYPLCKLYSFKCSALQAKLYWASFSDRLSFNIFHAFISLLQ